ncbi:magnesium transporter [Spiroplasma cantharicola]|uniref:Magnesium transporter MgtE n=1 Tax=Spiroplasma cantharicola TaxID=362837 RepID=A0A0M4JVX6_9MOLU|nr:magnesium transporter [Spiroplasma cantharicola]ALD65992.1 Mg2+ transport protein [Spiroplasma cantharicola]
MLEREEKLKTLSEEIEKVINANNIKELRKLEEEHYPQDIAEALEKLEDKITIVALRLFTNDTSSEIFPHLDADIQEEIINKMSSKQVSLLFSELYTDDIVDILEEMPSNIVKKILRSSTPETRAQINSILKYNDDTAGSIMSVDYTRFKINWTVTEAIEKIRERDEESEDHNTFYVVDDLNNLKGIVELKDLVFSKGETLLSEIMDERVIFARTKDDQESVIELFKKYDITTLPVINVQQKLVGIVTVDDVLDVIEEEVTEDIHKMAGISPTDDEYFKTSIWKMVRSRSVWLLLLMLSATFSQIIISVFIKIYHSKSGSQGISDQNSISYIIMILLAPLLTVISGTTGNAGSQSSTMIVRALSLKEVETKDYARVMWKEFRVAIITGLILVTVNFVRMIIIYSIEFKGNLSNPNLWYTIATISIAMYLSLIMAKLVGGTLPIIAKKLKLDPAIMASPLLTTLVDALSTALFFSVGLIFFI